MSTEATAFVSSFVHALSPTPPVLPARSSTRPSPHHHAPTPRSTTPVASNPSPQPSTPPTSIYRCPSCNTPIPLTTTTSSSDDDTIPFSQFPSNCPTCNARFPRRHAYIDLTDSPNRLLPSPLDPIRQATFQNPLVAFSYERGWRDAFARAGFPGPSIESALALDFFHQTPHSPSPSHILDLSCGSGILTRLLAKASHSPVTAVDLSHPMLLEASSRAQANPDLPHIHFIRADVNNLPFTDNSFHSIHAGAAIHCWPRLQDSLQQVRRVLAPQGRFFATTFLRGGYFSINKPSRPLAQFVNALDYLLPVTQPYRFFEKDELVYLLRAAGFASVDVQVIDSCAIIRCINP